MNGDLVLDWMIKIDSKNQIFSDPFKKFQAGEATNIEETLLNLSEKHSKVDLIIWPESPFPYLNSSPQMKGLLSKTSNFPIILSGTWEYNNNKS